MLRHALFAAAAAAFVAPALVSAQMAAVPTREFLMKAGASDLFERQEGQLMSTSANAEVRRFA